MKKIYKYIGAVALFIGSLSLNGQTILIDEDFSGTTGTTPPTGWTNNEILAGGGLWAFDNPGGQTLNAPITDPAAVFDSDDIGNDGNAENTALESPQFDASALAGDLILSFDHYFYTSFTTSTFYVEVYDGTQWVEILTGTTDSPTDPVSESIDITAEVNGAANAQVRFRYEGDWSYYWIVDNVQVEDVTCPAPFGLSVSNITDNSADFDWTENGSATTWNIEWGTPGFIPGTGNQLNDDLGNTSQTSNLTGLSPSTPYDVYVQADCGGEQSSWSGPFSFNTTQIPVSSFPWDEDFEAGGTEWTLLNGAQTNQWFVGTAISNGGSNSLYISDDGGTSHNYDNGASSATFAYRDISMPATMAEATLTFDWLCDGESSFSSWDFLNVWAVPTSFTPTLGTELTASGSAPTGIIDLTGVLGEELSFQTNTFQIPAAYAGEDFRLVFQWENDGGGGQNPPAVVDNVNITVFNCLAPSGLIASDITTDEATVSWDDNTSGAPSFEVEYGPAGFTPGTGTTVVVTDTFAVLTGLTQDQDYEYYVSAECGDGTFSQQSTVDAFSTLIACDPVTGLSLVEVTSTSVELTWSAPVGYSNFVIEYGPAGFTLGSGTTVAAPPTVVSGLDDDTEYDFYVYSDCGGGSFSQPEGPINVTTPPICPTPSDIVFTEIGADSVVVSWTVNGSETDWVIEYGETGFTQGTGTIVNTTFNPDTLLGLNAETEYDVYVWADCGSGDLSDTISGSFTTEPTCLAPTDLVFSEIGADSVVVEWTANGTATDWVIEYDTAGFTPGTGTIVNTTDNPDTLLGLNPEWTYDVYVYSDCGGGDLSDTISDSFTTQPSCLAPSDIVFSEIGTDSVVVEWTENGDAVDWVIEYGMSGFTPGTGTIVNTTDNPDTLTGLDQNTEYDVYVWSDCGSGDLSDTISGTFTTDPTCPPISDIQLDSISNNFAELSWTEGGNESSWNIEYDTTGFTLGNGTVEAAGTNPYGLTGLESNYSYDVYITADCGGGDLADTIGAFTFMTDPSCGDTIYDEGGATANYPSDMDNVITIRSSSANQYVRVTFEEFDYESDYDGMYVYDGEDVNAPVIPSANAAGFGSVTDPGAYWGTNIPGPFTSEVLTFEFLSDGIFQNPGHKAFIDCFDCDPTPGVDGEEDVCQLDDTLDLNTLVTLPTHPDTARVGAWTFPVNPGVLVDDSLLIVTSLAAGTYEAMYILNTPCGGDTTIATINVYGPSNAGQNGTLNVCQNEPVNLFDGLNGNVDLGGTWYDPSDNPIAGSQPVASSIPGSFNYDYITSNGVCPADTALVEVIVAPDCDYLSLGEEKLTELTVFPNPATNVINIANPSNSESLRVEILDMNGRVVLTDAKALANATEGSIDVSQLVKGMYTLRVYNEEGQKTFKVVIQ